MLVQHAAGGKAPASTDLARHTCSAIVVASPLFPPKEKASRCLRRLPPHPFLSFLKFLSRTRWLRPGRFGGSRTPSSGRPGGAYTTYLLNYELFTSRLQNASASGKLSVSFSECLVVARMAKERMGQGPGSMTEPVCKALFASVAQSLAMSSGHSSSGRLVAPLADGFKRPDSPSGSSRPAPISWCRRARGSRP